MCAGAIFSSRLKRLVYGATDWRASSIVFKSNISGEKSFIIFV